MNEPVAVPARERRRRRRRRRIGPWALRAIVVLAALAVGIALGEALHDNPTPGRGTNVRTLRPVTLPGSNETVTVTVTTG